MGDSGKKGATGGDPQISQISPIRMAGRTRRDVLKIIGTVPAAVAAMSSSPLVGGDTDATNLYQPKVLDLHEWKTVRVLSDLIIPADDRSGSATQAGVPEFIDDWLGVMRGTLLTEIRGGLTWLDLECNRLYGHDFVECRAAQQAAILDRIAYPGKAAPQDANAVAFFNRLRDLVVAGFFSSETGVKDLPYLGNTTVGEWKGCPDNVLAKLRLGNE